MLGYLDSKLFRFYNKSHIPGILIKNNVTTAATPNSRIQFQNTPGRFPETYHLSYMNSIFLPSLVNTAKDAIARVILNRDISIIFLIWPEVGHHIQT